MLVHRTMVSEEKNILTFSLQGPAAPYPGLQQHKGKGARAHSSRLQPQGYSLPDLQQVTLRICLVPTLYLGEA